MAERKKLRNSNRRRRNVWAGEIEFQVAAILLDFPDLVSKPTPGIASLLSTTTWASKKRRSAIDVADADDFMLVDNHSHTAAPLPLTLSEHRSLFKPRRKSGSTKIEEESLKVKVAELTECRDTLKTGIVEVLAYHEKLLNENAALKAMKEEELNYKKRIAELRKKMAEARKKLAVATNPKNGETNAATHVFPCQQPVPFHLN
ncbi:hypothetical protein ACET3Z_015636 [Daucus carota]